MEDKNCYLINPFHIKIDPMERLLLLNFEKDPDSIYLGFEPQVFDDKVHGRGHLVIGWRQDGKVDVYHQPGLTLDPGRYDITGKGLASMVSREFEQASYEVDDFGVQAHYSFHDIQDRQVKIRINEKNPKNRKPFGLLAPMGDAAENPSAIPLVLLKDFYFVRKRYTDIEISIAGKLHKPDELPLPIDGTKMLFTRYSPEPVIATLNPDFHDELKPLEIKFQENSIREGECDLELKWVEDNPYIRRITMKNHIHPLTLTFKDAFPDIKSLEIGTVMEGEFEISGHPTTGKTGGVYMVDKEREETTITMVPSKGWQPEAGKFSLRIIYALAKIFKTWPKTYKWTAHVQESGNSRFHMESRWERINLED